MPHRGVLSPAEKSLYVSFNNAGGPYDGSAGAFGKYSMSGRFSFAIDAYHFQTSQAETGPILPLKSRALGEFICVQWLPA